MIKYLKKQEHSQYFTLGFVHLHSIQWRKYFRICIYGCLINFHFSVFSPTQSFTLLSLVMPASKISDL